jgi:hypothetical protein
MKRKAFTELNQTETPENRDHLCNSQRRTEMTAHCI